MSNRPTMRELARQYGCTVEQMTKQFLRQADALHDMAVRAHKTGRRVNGYTESELLEQEAATRAQVGVQS